MSSLKFIGIIVVRDCTWNYKCWNCQKIVEKTNSVYHGFGETVEIWNTGRAYLDDYALSRYRAQAKAEAPERFENSLKEWKENGVYPEGLKDDGECPFCRKHQIWDGYYSQTSRSTLGHILVSFRAGFLISGALFLISAIVWGFSSYLQANYDSFMVFLGVLCLLLTTLIARHAIKAQPKRQKDLEELQKKDYTYPTFVKWGRQYERTHASTH